MWSRAQLKDKAKFAFRRNYWKVVLVSVLVILFGGGSSSAPTFNYTNSVNSNENYEDSLDNFYGDVDDYYDEDIYDSFYDDSIYGDVEDELDEDVFFIFGAVFFIVLAVVLIIAIVIGVLLQTFLLNPLAVGGKRFFFKNLNDTASVKEIAFAFDNNYKNVVKVMFFKELYTFLWSLLFIIPGIIKSYEYKMIPFLLAENPAMTKEQAFALSKQMMEGQKWKTFVLDLSFIGWHLLSAYTLGILDIFYVRPYVNMTEAALYEALCYQRSYTGYGAPQGYMQTNPYAQANPYTMQQPNMTTPVQNATTAENAVPVQSVEQTEDNNSQEQ